MAPADIEIQAAGIARRVVRDLLEAESEHGDIRSVRIRTYADDEAYRMLGPRSAQETWALHTAINRHLESRLARHGIAVEFVVLSACAYREWLGDGVDGPESRNWYCDLVERALDARSDGDGRIH